MFIIRIKGSQSTYEQTHEGTLNGAINVGQFLYVQNHLPVTVHVIHGNGSLGNQVWNSEHERVRCILDACRYWLCSHVRMALRVDRTVT